MLRTVLDDMCQQGYGRWQDEEHTGKKKNKLKKQEAEKIQMPCVLVPTLISLYLSHSYPELLCHANSPQTIV